jgi:hypothetical protein
MAAGHEHGLGPELEGMRITVHTLLPHFLDPAATEAYICELYDLKPEQVAAARAYVLNNPDVVMGDYLQTDDRLAAGNSQQLIDAAHETRARLHRFKEWLAQRDRRESAEDSAEAHRSGAGSRSRTLLTFKQWLADRESRPGEAS